MCLLLDLTILEGTNWLHLPTFVLPFEFFLFYDISCLSPWKTGVQMRDMFLFLTLKVGWLVDAKSRNLISDSIETQSQPPLQSTILPGHGHFDNHNCSGLFSGQ